MPHPPRISCVTALVLSLSLLLITACGPYHPLGIDDAQWQNLSAEQRLAAQLQQAELDRAREARRAAEAHAREAEAQRHRAELETRRREAAYGDRVQCILDEAEARLGGQWRSIEPVAMDLVRDFAIDLSLTSLSQRNLRHRSNAHAHFDGLTVSICEGPSRSAPLRSHCAQLRGTHADYHRGLSATIEAERFLRGQLRCDLVPAARGHRVR